MNVIVLPVFLGLVLVSFFVFMFLHQSKDPRGASSERDSLLPLQDEFISKDNTRHIPTPESTSHE